MKRIKLIPVLIVLGWMIGCESEAPVAPEAPGALGPVATKADKAATSSTSNVYTIATMEDVGNSKLVRNNSGVSFKLSTSELEPGHAYTLWMVIFNNPEDCRNGCDGEDFAPFNTDAGIDVLYSAGTLAGGTGKATFAGHRMEGDNSGSNFGEGSLGLVDSRKAEIHFVVRTHGPKIPGLIGEQIGTFNGGCDPGQPNEGLCQDIQFAVHK